MIYDISHRTLYRYSQPVSISHHVLHLSPRPHPRQVCHRSVLAMNPTPTVCTRSEDYFGNPVAFLAFQDQHSELSIAARSVVEVSEPEVPDPAATMPWTEIAALLRGDLAPETLDALQYAFHSPSTRHTADLAGFARSAFAPGRPMLAAALDLTAAIHRDFEYDPSATTVSTPVDEVFAIRRGVCQDFAHLEIACLRALGLPARYVSGYLLTRPPEGQEKLVGADASHAWLSVWCPGHGWVDLDPTNNAIPGCEHICLAWGREYGDVSPINGVIYGGGRHEVEVAVDVMPAGGEAAASDLALSGAKGEAS